MGSKIKVDTSMTMTRHFHILSLFMLFELITKNTIVFNVKMS